MNAPARASRRRNARLHFLPGTPIVAGLRWGRRQSGAVGAYPMTVMREDVAAARPERGVSVVGAARRFWRIPLMLAVLVMMAGCAGPERTGANFDMLTKTVGPPKAGQARIIVLRDKAFPGIFDVGWQVKLDGAPMGDLKTGTFVYRDRAPGSHQLTFERGGDFSRASHNTFTAAPGRTYFFRLEMNEKGKMIQASASVAGLAGMFISSAASAAADDRGLFDFTPLDEVLAREAMADLRLAE